MDIAKYNRKSNRILILNAQPDSQVHYVANIGTGKAVRPNFVGVRESVRRSMKSNRGKDNQLELKFRRALCKAGLRGYRVNVKNLPGRPDVAWIGRKVAVFLHGCFWHGCTTCSERKNLKPTTRADYWSDKVQANKDRDDRNRSSLESQGWTVLVFWEHEVKTDLSRAILLTESVLKTR